MLYNKITDCIGKTPLLEIAGLSGNAKIFAKLEFLNPLASVKDRIAFAMVKRAERLGLLKDNTTIIEPTSGNTGIGLAYICASKGYKLVLTMPETMSLERRNLLKALGAQLFLTPGSEFMPGAIRKAKEVFQQIPGSYMPMQFENPANPEVHRKTTGPEIYKDMKGEVDVFVAGVGTGGTITGVGEFLKKKKSNVRIIAVEPASSPVLSGGIAGPHKIQGIGAGFVPKVLKRSVIDEILQVTNEEARDMAKYCALKYGVFIGISAGAALSAAKRIADIKENENKNIVTIFADSAERYLTSWMFE